MVMVLKGADNDIVNELGVKSVAFLFIREVKGSNLGVGTFHHDQGFP